MIGNFKKALVTTASAGAFSIGLSLNPAMAGPLTFTWSPTAAGLTTTPVGSNITANNIDSVADFADITIAGATFTENAVIQVESFKLGGSSAVYSLAPFTFNGLNTSYVLYAVVNATGNTPGIPPSGSGLATTGNFTSATYTFYGATPGATGMAVSLNPGGSPTISDISGAIPLFSGTLISGTDTLTAPLGGGYSPTANLNLSLTACTSAGQVLPSGVVCTANETGFFVSPLPQYYSLVIGNFSASTSVTSLTGSGPFFLDINGGGGNITFEAKAPEPTSLLLFGSGLIGLGSFFARRKRRTVQA